jgi:hypothetical protein
MIASSMSLQLLSYLISVEILCRNDATVVPRNASTTGQSERGQ